MHEVLLFRYAQSELDNIKEMWNNHRIRNSINAEYPGGRLDIRYFNPAAAGATDRSSHPEVFL